MRTPQQRSGVNAAVDAAGSQTALAKAIGVSQQAISKWVRDGRVPPERALAIEGMFGVPRADLVGKKLRKLLSGLYPPKEKTPD